MDTKTRLSVYESIRGIVGERTSPLPKATAFSLLFSYAGKDHKFVSKLTDIGGKLDRKKKEVYFDFTSAAARTKFRKKHKDIIKSLSESVELDELRMAKWPKGDPRAGQLVHKSKGKTRKQSSPKIKYAKIVKGIRDSQGPFSVVAIKGKKVVAQKNSIKNSKMLPIEVNDMADAHPGATISIESRNGKILNTFKESVELDEGTPAYRKAMAAYKNSDTKKVFDILKKKGFRAYAQSDTLVRNMLKKNKGNVQKAAAEIEKKYPGHFK